MNKEDIEKLYNHFESLKKEGKGFIFMPTPQGFNVFEIPEERLKHYLHLEEFAVNNESNLKQQPENAK